MTGYGEFFDEIDPGCNTVIFARTANPNFDEKDRIKLTIEFRKDFNHMSRALNTAIQDAVNRNTDEGVKFIDIQGDKVFHEHHFQEPRVQKPDQHNNKF